MDILIMHTTVSLLHFNNIATTNAFTSSSSYDYKPTILSKFHSTTSERSSNNHRIQFVTTACSAAASTTTTTTTTSIGALVQEAKTIPELFSITEHMWLPTDLNLPGHLSCQLVHHEKRQRWASQWMEKFADSYLSSSSSLSRMEYLQDERFTRAIWAIALPFKNNHQDRYNKEGSYLLTTLQGLHAILGSAYQQQQDDYHKIKKQESTTTPTGDNHHSFLLSKESLEGISIICERAISLSSAYPIQQLIQMRWAIQGLAARVPLTISNMNILNESTEERLQTIPFDIIPCVINYNEFFSTQQHTLQEEEGTEDITAHGITTAEVLEILNSVIPFQQDIITTRSGSNVIERRRTAWIAENGIGALAYSGKLMPPQPIPNVVQSIMRTIEEKLGFNNNYYDFFDCALCNHYPDGESACKFHTDPEHGTHWDTTNCVIAVSEQPRKFAFKPIMERTTWKEWDTAPPSTLSSKNNNDDAAAVATWLFSGDVVIMKDSCNDDFYHAVYAGGGERVSLVFKRALLFNGKKGHGLAGQGRKSKRKQKQSVEGDIIDSSAPSPSPQQRHRRPKATKNPKHKSNGTHKKTREQSTASTGANNKNPRRK